VVCNKILKFYYVGNFDVTSFIDYAWGHQPNQIRDYAVGYWNASLNCVMWQADPLSLSLLVRWNTKRFMYKSKRIVALFLEILTMTVCTFLRDITNNTQPIMKQCCLIELNILISNKTTVLSWWDVWFLVWPLMKTLWSMTSDVWWRLIMFKHNLWKDKVTFLCNKVSTNFHSSSILLITPHKYNSYLIHLYCTFYNPPPWIIKSFIIISLLEYLHHIKSSAFGKIPPFIITY
jgi:hypothetical protein